MLTTQMTLGQAFRSVSGSRPDQEALVCGDVRLAYGQLRQRIHALACGLHELGIGKGDQVVILLPPGPDFVTVFFAVAELGGRVVPVNPQIRRRGLTGVLRDAEPAALVATQPPDDEVLEGVSSLRHLILTERGRSVYKTRHCERVPFANEAISTLADLMSEGDIGPPPADVSPEDLVALLYTSGTTGTPKGTMHTHRSLIMPVVATLRVRQMWSRPTFKTLGRTVKALARYRERLLRHIGQPQTFLSTVGWHTITGLEVMFQGLLMGDRLVVMPRFHPREALELIERERVTIPVGVPMAYQVMMGLSDSEHYDTSSLLVCGVGAAPCPPHLAQEIERRFRCAVHIGYGATEMGGGIAVTSLADSDQERTETVGRPMPGMEVKIVDEGRRQLPPGEVGELACRSDGVMLGYYRAPDITAQVLDEDGWYYTGDLARVDERGYVQIVGRKKDVIIRGGQNIYPPEIESHLTSHPHIRESAVVGVPSDAGGESVWAFVILEEGSEMTEREVLDHCRASLEPYKTPSHVRFVADLPRSNTGKPQKFKLRAMALQEAQEDESL
jgi:acyl-CoA synthetase (AMP-forming)/AMP-acid ligase II